MSYESDRSKSRIIGVDFAHAAPYKRSQEYLLPESAGPGPPGKIVCLINLSSLRPPILLLYSNIIPPKIQSKICNSTIIQPYGRKTIRSEANLLAEPML